MCRIACFCAKVTVNALDTLGIHRRAGHFFRRAMRLRARITMWFSLWVLAATFWRRASAIGREMRIDGILRRIIG